MAAAGSSAEASIARRERPAMGCSSVSRFFVPAEGVNVCCVIMVLGISNTQAASPNRRGGNLPGSGGWRVVILKFPELFGVTVARRARPRVCREHGRKARLAVTDRAMVYHLGGSWVPAA